MGDEGTEDTVTKADELVDDILTTVLLVVISGKVTWAVDTTTMPTVKISVIPGVEVGLFQNKCSGSSRAGSRP
jgi:hypothetical protein